MMFWGRGGSDKRGWRIRQRPHSQGLLSPIREFELRPEVGWEPWKAQSRSERGHCIFKLLFLVQCGLEEAKREVEGFKKSLGKPIRLGH